MPTVTLSLPEDLKKAMDECPEINWSEVARAAIRKKLTELLLFKSIVSKSKLTEEDAEKFALELGKKVNKSLYEKLKKDYPSLF